MGRYNMGFAFVDILSPTAVVAATISKSGMITSYKRPCGSATGHHSNYLLPWQVSRMRLCRRAAPRMRRSSEVRVSHRASAPARVRSCSTPLGIRSRRMIRNSNLRSWGAASPIVGSYSGNADVELR